MATVCNEVLRWLDEDSDSDLDGFGAWGTLRLLSQAPLAHGSRASCFKNGKTREMLQNLKIYMMITIL